MPGEHLPVRTDWAEATDAWVGALLNATEEAVMGVVGASKIARVLRERLA